MPVVDEDLMIRALNATTPAEIIHSEKLLCSFRAFFSRGSIQDFSQLLPSLPTADTVPLDGKIYSEVEKTIQSTTAYREPGNAQHCPKHSQASCNTQISRVERPIISSASASKRLFGATGSSRNHDDCDASEMWEYFAARVKPRPRIQTLIRVVSGSAKAVQHKPSFYQNLWSTNKDNIFGAETSAESRLSRLFRGRKKINRHQQRFECASRLSLLFLAHDVAAMKSCNWELGPGQSRQHAAVLAIAHHLGVATEEIKKEWRRSRNYVKLLEACGPGSLLELGSGVNWYWEKAMAKDDVTHFINFRREKMTHLDKRSRELNLVAGGMILDGMLAYGWTIDAISRTSTPVRNALIVHCPTLFSSPSKYTPMNDINMATAICQDFDFSTSASISHSASGDASGTSASINGLLAATTPSLEPRSTEHLCTDSLDKDSLFGGNDADFMSNNYIHSSEADFVSLTDNIDRSEYSETFSSFYRT